MKSALECIPCFMHQALRAGRMATADEKLQKRVLDAAGAMVSGISLEMTPPQIGERLYREIREITGIQDPYRAVKDRDIAEALAFMPELRGLLEASEDRLVGAVRLAIAGNVIDHGVQRQYDMRSAVEAVMQQPFALCDFEAFLERLDRTPFVLYLGDNAGESVFDSLLIEALQKPVIYVVRDNPVINDVIYADAVASGIGEVAEKIISSGSGAPGTLLNRCSREFMELFGETSLVISKGQGNYEALSDCGEHIFFLLRAKCPVIAEHLGVAVDDIVLKQGT